MGWVQDLSSAFLWGLGGGVVAVLVAWTPFARGETKKMPMGPRIGVYWTVTVAWIVFGGIWAFGWDKQKELADIVAMQLGLLAPVTVQRLMDKDDPAPIKSVD